MLVVHLYTYYKMNVSEIDIFKYCIVITISQVCTIRSVAMNRALACKLDIDMLLVSVFPLYLICR